MNKIIWVLIILIVIGGLSIGLGYYFNQKNEPQVQGAKDTSIVDTSQTNYLKNQQTEKELKRKELTDKITLTKVKIENTKNNLDTKSDQIKECLYEYEGKNKACSSNNYDPSAIIRCLDYTKKYGDICQSYIDKGKEYATEIGNLENELNALNNELNRNY